MALLEATFGPLQRHYQITTDMMIPLAPVLPYTTVLPHLHVLEKITFVSRRMLEHTSVSGILKIHCGTRRGV